MSITYPAKDNMLAIEVGGSSICDEKLAAICVGACVGTAQQARCVMRELEVLVLEGLPVNTLSPCTITPREITALDTPK